MVGAFVFPQEARMTEKAMREAYASDRMGRPYGYRSSVYTNGYHRGQDVRKLNPTGTASVVTDVVSLSPGVVADIRRPNDLLGVVVTIDTGRVKGRYEHHGHMVASVIEGERVSVGERLGRNAAFNENPGSGWTAPHDHFVISDYIDGAWNTSRPTYDPMTFIRSALAAPAGAAAYKHKKVTLAYVNLRKSPKTGDIITTIPKGKVVLTGSTVKGWTPVKYGKKAGWIAAEFAVMQTKHVTYRNLTLRSKPAPLKKSAKNPNPAKVVARLKKGTKVTVLEVHGKTSSATYWKVRVGLRVGWVIGKFLK